MTETLGYIAIVVLAISSIWKLHSQGWKLKSPIPRNPWMASAFLTLAVVLIAKLSWHRPDVRMQLNIIIAMMVLPAAVQLYRTLRDSRQAQTPPLWRSYGTVCLCCFLVADAVSFVLQK